MRVLTLNFIRYSISVKEASSDHLRIGVSAMDWGIVGTVLAIVFFTMTVILTLRLARRKKPVWACETTKIVGLGTDAPPELKLSFGGIPVSEVYQTSLIFFNKGVDIIDKDDVTDRITIHFRGARILRQPNIKAPSNDKIRFSAKQVIKEGDDSIQLDFLYLAHHDGAIIEVMHTESQQIRHTGNIKGVEIKKVGEFEPSKISPKVVRLIVSLAVTVIAVSLIIINQYFDFETLRELIFTLYFILGMFGILLITEVLERIRYRRFPRWSRYKKRI